MFFKYVRIISETRLKCHKTELTMMHTFLNRKLTIFVCLAFGGLATGRAQVQPLPIIPPNALVQTYTGRLAHTLLNGYVKNDDARLSDSRTPQGTAGGDLSGTYPNPTIKASVNLSGNPTVAGKLTVNGTDESLIKGNLRLKGNGNYGNKLNFGDGDYVYLHEATDDNLTVKAKNIELAPTTAVTAPTPATTDNSTRIATTAYVKNNLANYVTTSDSRLSDSRPPNGTAGGDLSGTYPNPTIKASVNLSGNPTATTQDLSDNSARIATTAFVHNVRKARKLYGVNLSGVTGMWTDEGQVFYSSAPNFTVQLDSGLPIIAKTRVANSCHIVTEANTTTISVTLKFPNGNSTSKTITGLNASKHYLLHILCIKWSSGDPGATISIMEII